MRLSKIEIFKKWDFQKMRLSKMEIFKNGDVKTQDDFFENWDLWINVKCWKMRLFLLTWNTVMGFSCQAIPFSKRNNEVYFSKSGFIYTTLSPYFISYLSLPSEKWQQKTTKIENQIYIWHVQQPNKRTIQTILISSFSKKSELKQTLS